jgi:hypothetical protein
LGFAQAARRRLTDKSVKLLVQLIVGRREPAEA